LAKINFLLAFTFAFSNYGILLNVFL